MRMNYIFDRTFQKYGNVIDDIDFGLLIEDAKDIQADMDFDKQMEHYECCQKIKKEIFHEHAIQVKYYRGHNHTTNHVEFHATSEIFVAVSDCVIFLGMNKDLEPNQVYHMKHMEGFFVPKGTAVRINPGVLHCTPCNINSYGFKMISIERKHTSEPLDEIERNQEDRTLFAKNQWLIVNKEAKIDGAFCGLKGESFAV